MRRFATRAVPPAEIASVRRYCAGLCRGVLDSPEQAADAVCRAVASGAAHRVLDELPARLTDVADDDVVTAEMVAQMRAGSVMVDVAIDQGGCFATSQPTTHSEPTY